MDNLIYITITHCIFRLFWREFLGVLFLSSSSSAILTGKCIYTITKVMKVHLSETAKNEAPQTSGESLDIVASSHQVPNQNSVSTKNSELQRESAPRPSELLDQPLQSITYIVKPSDTLEKIVLRHAAYLHRANLWGDEDSISQVAFKLARVNEIANPNRIRIGEK